MSPSLLPRAQLLPGELPDEELFWHWRQGIAGYFETLPLADPRKPPVRPAIRQYNVGQFLFIETSASRQQYLRDSEWMRRHDDTDHVILQTYVSGENDVFNGGRHFVQRPGSVTAVNLGYQVDARSADAEVLSLVLPRTLLEERMPALREARGELFEAASTGERIFHEFMLSLRRHLPRARTDEAAAVTDGLFGLLGGLLGAAGQPSSTARTATTMALLRYIDANIGNPELGTDALCAQFRISRATLFRLFKDLGGVQSHIQRRRLMACMRALTAPQSIDRPIYDVAFDHGLTNASHFSSLFRQHFGMTPSEAREAARHRLDREAGPVRLERDDSISDAEVMQIWARQLGASPDA